MQPEDEAPRITQADFKKLVAAKNVIIVDTRNADAYAAGHIPGALLLPLEGQLTWSDADQKNVVEPAEAREETDRHILRLTRRSHERPCGAHA